MYHRLVSPGEFAQSVERKLVAILAADVVGSSRLMEADEEGTISRLTTYRAIIGSLVEAHHGRVFGGAGDSVVAEFPSPVEAVRCAIDMQHEIGRQNSTCPPTVTWSSGSGSTWATSSSMGRISSGTA
jgi:class 3 adenylate cyclase